MKKALIYFYITILKYFYGFGKISTSLVYAQAWHETGGFQSNIYRENNNLFGMRKAKIRKSPALGERNGSAYYRSDFDSIRDYFSRQKNFRINSESDELFLSSTVNSGYAEDPNYKTKWETTFRTLVKPFDFFKVLTGFFVSLFVVLIFRFIISAVWNLHYKPQAKRKINAYKKGSLKAIK